MSGALHTYRKVIALTGPLLPVVSFLGRLPTAMGRLGSVLLVAESSGGLATAGLAGGALALGQTAGGPLAGRAVDRTGSGAWCSPRRSSTRPPSPPRPGRARPRRDRPAGAAGGARRGRRAAGRPAGRSRTVPLARRAGTDERTVVAALSFEGTLDEVSFVFGPAFVGLAAALAHPAVALLVAAGLPAVCGTAFALQPTAGQVVAEEHVRAPRTRLPRAV
ncbi:hypothetical protein [Streptomyces sp. NPDC059994]|uniref:hypothetical protein n=1 Tax=Streptomyces sp. NPDC059994 TaxID=3347029 RepID=UPI0036C47A8F